MKDESSKNIPAPANSVAAVIIFFVLLFVFAKWIQESVNKKSQALVDALKSMGINKEDIKTVSYNLYPQYDYTTSTTNRITGYQISTNYQVKVKDFDKVNEVLTTATGVGANAIGSVSFEVNDETEKEKLNEARELAVKEAKAKADGLSKAAGINLGNIVNISESQNSGDQIRPLYGMGGAPDVTTKEIAVADIEPGQTEIQVTVSLSFEVR
ncbi:MAG: hypothetical protein UU74_C0046G0002 [Candidatus Woesebacteria bacterium GW2011_GWA1_41_7]|uniref:26 kDa periplasmic immunogenic protein n=1 Tax=Candidatus Woesebacteria bacterium GW2011_GWA1_41_7 TaxID=1618556 RepID=A0A0G0ZTD9_9BACT|nr:MAG: hypothetical protein UU74_C0046G0002 [Candidatus Woesebacteria bacterium GW2011_GWA1_41_7]